MLMNRAPLEPSTAQPLLRATPACRSVSAAQTCEVTFDARPLESLAEYRQSNEPHPAVGIIDLFLSGSRKRIVELRKSLARQDAPAIAAEAHGLKGSSGQIGAQRLAAACAELERRGNLGALADAESLVEAIDGEYARLEALLLEERALLAAS
jgi:HPt (histidine-containing phosphotransfer) domain-containing protein